MNGGRTVVFLLFLALFAANLALAADPPYNPGDKVTDKNFWDFFVRYAVGDDVDRGGLMQPTSVALLIGVSLVALGWMLSEFFVLPQMKAWVKSEMYEVGASAVMVAMVMFLLMTFSLMSQELTGDADFFSTPQNFLSNLKAVGINQYVQLNTLEMGLGFLSTLHLSVYMPATPINRLSLNMAPGIGATMVSEGNILVTDFIGFAIAGVAVQQVILEFFQATMLKIFLPMGIFLRALGFTRKVGSSLVALAITGFFVFPIAVMIVEQMVVHTEFRDYARYDQMIRLGEEDPAAARDFAIRQFGENGEANRKGKELLEGTGRDRDIHLPLAGTIDCNTRGGKNFFKNTFCTFYAFMKGSWEMVKGVYSAPFEFLKIIWNSIESLVDVRRVPVGLYYSQVSRVQAMSEYLAFVAIGIVAEIIITVTAYRSIAGAIGGEVEIFGLQKLV